MHYYNVSQSDTNEWEIDVSDQKLIVLLKDLFSDKLIIELHNLIVYYSEILYNTICYNVR